MNEVGNEIYTISPKESPFLRNYYERKYITLIEYSGYDERVRKWCRKQQEKKFADTVTFEWAEDELTLS